jgi:hypothetical protein
MRRQTLNSPPAGVGSQFLSRSPPGAVLRKWKSGDHPAVLHREALALHDGVDDRLQGAFAARSMVAAVFADHAHVERLARFQADPSQLQQHGLVAAVREIRRDQFGESAEHRDSVHGVRLVEWCGDGIDVRIDR